MKVYKLFTLALAALAFAACSDDEVPNPNPNPDENWQADIEGLTINFATLAKPTTRAFHGTTPSIGTEAAIYKAFVFAREANPQHERAVAGDWTVIECAVDPTTKLVEGEKKVDNPDGTVTVKNVATFHGVRQGDNVYVIANDPNLTFRQAEALAHQAGESEAAIKAYAATMPKKYLGGLAYPSKDKPDGQFVMAGMATIPVAPTLPSNGTVELEVGLDRELAKVDFKANVTTDAQDEAYQVVEFREGDGITVLRIAPKTSMFTERESSFYVPDNCVENWPINNHSYVDGIFSAYCDQTIEGSKMFDGLAKTAFEWNGVQVPDSFNLTEPAAGVQEYRYSWVLPANVGTASDIKFGDSKTDMFYGTPTDIYAPMFYTSPNYSKDINAVTSICTQATYIGKDVFMNSGLNDAVDKALACTTEKITFAAGSANVEIKNPLWVVDGTKTASFIASIKTILGIEGGKVAGKGLGLQYRNKAAESESAADFEAILTKYGLTAATNYNLPTAAGTDIESVALDRSHYEAMMDKFYTAVILQFRLANDVQVVGDMNTELGNKVPEGITAYFYDPASQADPDNTELLPTDYLLLGTANVDYQLKDETGTPLANATPSTPIFCFYEQGGNVKVTSENFANGKDARLSYFAKDDAFKYFTNMKLYYRADIADYVDNVSSRITERNVYYQTTGTIQSLGARTIHDAVYSDRNTMKVDVKVNDWRLSINNIPM